MGHTPRLSDKYVYSVQYTITLALGMQKGLEHKYIYIYMCHRYTKRTGIGNGSHYRNNLRFG